MGTATISAPAAETGIDVGDAETDPGLQHGSLRMYERGCHCDDCTHAATDTDRQRRDRREAAGLCRICGKHEPAAGLRICDPCRSIRSRQHQERKTRIADRRNRGVCVGCESDDVIVNTTRCFDCIAANPTPNELRVFGVCVDCAESEDLIASTPRCFDCIVANPTPRDQRAVRLALELCVVCGVNAAEGHERCAVCIPHGTPTGYTQHGCRCPICSEAAADYGRRRRAERSEHADPGLCSSCLTREPEDGRKTCEVCLAYKRRRYQLTVADRRSRGVCVTCEADNLRDGVDYCDICLAKKRAAGKVHYARQVAQTNGTSTLPAAS